MRLKCAVFLTVFLCVSSNARAVEFSLSAVKNTGSRETHYLPFILPISLNMQIPTSRARGSKIEVFVKNIDNPSIELIHDSINDVTASTSNNAHAIGNDNETDVSVEKLKGGIVPIKPLHAPSISAASRDSTFHNLGVRTTSGILNAADIQSVLSAISAGTTIKMSLGEAYPINSNGRAATSLQSSLFNKVFIQSDGQFLTPAMENAAAAGSPAWNGGHLADKVGDSALVQDFEPKFGIMRDRTYTSNDIFDYRTYRKPAPITSDFYTVRSQWVRPTQCSSPQAHGYNAYWCNGINWGTSIHKNILTSSSNVGVGVFFNDVYSSGFGYGGAYDVLSFNRLHQAGTNWSWVSVDELDETGSLSAGGYTLDGKEHEPNAQHYVDEWDMSGIGSDRAATSYTPFASRRYGLWFNTWISGGSIWKSNRIYHQYQILLVHNPKDNNDYMYENIIEGGKSGSTIPLFTFKETNPVYDGTAKWLLQGKKSFQIGCIICIGSDKEAKYGTLLSSLGHIYNSSIDLSEVSYDTIVPVVMRTAPNTYYDLSAHGTKNSQNQHLFGYGHMGGVGWDTLDYEVKGKTVFDVEDSGVIGSSVEHYKAIGHTITEATPVNASFVEITEASSDGAGIRLNFAGQGDDVTIGNNSLHTITIWPINTRWKINAATSYTLTPGTVVHARVVDSNRYWLYDNNSNTTSSNVKPAFSSSTLTHLPTSGLSDGQHARCSDCSLNGKIGVDAVWNASSSTWTDEMNNALHR